MAGSTEPTHVYGHGSFGCVSSRLLCEDEKSLPADATNQIGKLFYLATDAKGEYELAKKVEHTMDPAHLFTPRVHKLCRVEDVPDIVRQKCTVGESRLTARPQQLIMDYGGRAWDQLGALPVSRWLEMLDALLLGVRTMQAQNQLHMDLKPDNILLTDTGKVNIIDFSLMTPLPSVFDVPYTREDREYSLWPPEFAMLRAIRQQVYDRLSTQHGGQRPRMYWDLIALVPDNNQSQRFLDRLDTEPLDTLNLPAIVDAGISRFRATFEMTVDQAEALARGPLIDYLNMLIQTQRVNGQSAKQTMLTTANGIDMYSIASAMFDLSKPAKRAVVFDTFVTEAEWKRELVAPAGYPVPTQRLTLADFHARVQRLRQQHAAAQEEEARRRRSLLPPPRHVVVPPARRRISRSRYFQRPPITLVMPPPAPRPLTTAIIHQQQQQQQLRQRARLISERRHRPSFFS